jgi:dynein heavy chain, axonemal
MDMWQSVVPSFRYDPAVPFFHILVPSIDTTRYSFLLEACLQINRGVLFTGPSGVGKTAVVSSTLQRLEGPQRILPAVINFSAQTSSAVAQASIEARLEKRTKARWAARTKLAAHALHAG